MCFVTVTSLMPQSCRRTLVHQFFSQKKVCTEIASIVLVWWSYLGNQILLVFHSEQTRRGALLLLPSYVHLPPTDQPPPSVLPRTHPVLNLVNSFWQLCLKQTETKQCSVPSCNGCTCVLCACVCVCVWV